MALGEKSFFWDKPSAVLTEEEAQYYKYHAQDLASIYESMYTTGITPQMAISSPTDNPQDYIGSSLAVSAGNGLQLLISPGMAMIKGRGYLASLPIELTVSNGKTTDILLQMNVQQERPEIKIVTKERISGNSLIENIRHDSLVYEIAVASVSIPDGSIQVNPTMIIDQRLNTSLHPIDGKPISGLMKSIPAADTVGIWENWSNLQTYISNTFALFMDQSQSDYLAWFTQISQAAETDIARLTMQFEQFLTDKNEEFDLWFGGAQSIYMQKLGEAVEQAKQEVLEGVVAYDPSTGLRVPLQNILNNIYNATKTAPISAKEFRDLQMTAKEFRDKRISAYEFSTRGKAILGG